MTEPKPLRAHASCDAGLEAVVLAELHALGVTDARTAARGVDFRADWRTIWRCNLRCRVANRVLVSVASATVEGRDPLYDLIVSLPWEEWFPVTRTLAIAAHGVTPALTNTVFTAQLCKDAVCDRFRRVTGRRPSVDLERPDVVIDVRLRGRDVMVSLDTSGARLHLRGYRAQAREAPLRETLAAGLVALAGVDGATPFLDPMCGSGTIAIEAALRARRIAPGLQRLAPGTPGFSLTRLSSFDRRAFDDEVAACRAEERPAPARIRASDRDPRAIRVARDNARLAGVLTSIDFSVADVATVTSDADRVILITNPPYGVRLEAEDAVERTWSTLGDTLKQRFSGSSAFVLCPDRALERALGLSPTRRFPLYNGPIEVRLLQLDLWTGHRPSP